MYEFFKRAFDFTLALIALIILAPLLGLVALAVKLDSPGPVLFRGWRVGRGGKKFRIFKFRSMREQAERIGPGITRQGDARITRVGKFLRATKLDELPQLVNVVRGEMALVGPRPEDPRWVEHYDDEQRQVLSVRPGITSLASLRYRNEEGMLGDANWADAYANAILPDKLALELEYLAARSFALDLKILILTALAVLSLIPVPKQMLRWTYRYITWGVLDAGIVLFSYAFGFFVRALTTPLELLPALWFGAGAVVVYLLTNYLAGIYVRQWRYASSQDALYIFASTLFASSILGAIDIFFFSTRPVPLSVFMIGALCVIVLSTGARFHRRLLRGVGLMTTNVRRRFRDQTAGARALIVGAGEEGQLLAWQLQNRVQGKEYDLVAFVDDDPNKVGTLVHNTRIAGTREDIPRLCERLKIEVILIAIHPSKIEQPRQLLEICRATNAQIKIVPSVYQMLASPSSQPAWEEAREETLLNRQKFTVDDEACRALLTGKSVLVTGACGSIGSELARQIAAYAPAQLYLLDNNETGLYDLELGLTAHFRQVPKSLVLADITDAARVESVFQAYRPQVVFHAAAYKHVPILEAHPYEAVRVNVIGTRNVYDCARAYGTERFIFISSDKAVNPTNMLGLTKRVGEILVVQNGAALQMLSTAVRFGNVLGSRGSVLPTFTSQIERGGPVTITDPEMSRYFLSVSEAVSLVIQAATLTKGGDIFMLNMGEQVRILDLALRLIRLRGLRPYVDIEIQFIGARPGEKLKEELISLDEGKMPTAHEAIWRIQDRRENNDSHFERRLALYLETVDLRGNALELNARLRELLEPDSGVSVPVPSANESVSDPASSIPV